MLFPDRAMYSHLKIAAILLFVLLLEANCKKYHDNNTEDRGVQEIKEWKESKYSRERKYEESWKKEKRKNEKTPPPINEAALMARYIVNQAAWTSVATISVRKEMKSYPTVNVIALSDGVLGNGSGVPYLFLTPLDYTAQDLSKDDRATLLMTLAQGDYCTSEGYDPMDPRCARVILTGKIKKITNDTAEHSIAADAMFGRHPWLAHMPPNHHFYLAKLKMFSIVVLDTFGGPKTVSIEDYLHPPTNNATAEFLRRVDLTRSQNLEETAKMRGYETKLLQPVVRVV